MTLAPGTKLGRYEIRSKIGEGGMGEVYLALDTELDRMVAIKILPGHLASNQQRLQRFIQEAKATSALNHPHILTIHEIGIEGATRFIATEFIEGETLRPRITEGLKLTEILEIAIQTAGALAAAHAAGIIHRDIKPENIMIRSDGYIKVLDFGLAKLTDPAGSTTDNEAPTKTMVNTGAGTVMGTAKYMSPEQAKGTSVDARTDLWSLGAVLYEMVTGHAPFAGETPAETISLILQKEPAPLARYSHEVPAELERIVTKAVTKDREERYQTAKDVLIDLRNLKKKLEVDAEIDRAGPPTLRSATSTSGDHGPQGTASVPVAATASAGAAPAASSAQYIVSGIKQHKLAAAVAILVLVVVGVGLAFYLHARNNEVAIDSIAVLPFDNQNHDPETEYLSDGFTDSIINSLTQLPNLKVIARSSVFRYKGKQKDPIAVANELGVRAVLTGRIMQRGDSLTIGVELVDARDNKQLWGEQYERKLSDLISVQREIAQEITGNLRLRLSGAEQERANKHYTEKPDAYQLYLRGRFYWNKRTGEAIKTAIEYFNQAIEKDPGYALAYVGLADCYVVPANPQPPNEKMPKARAAAKRALELDETLAEAHTALARVLVVYDWDWAGAEKEFKRAIELNPRYAGVHQWYGGYLEMLGRRDESLAERRQALELDPLSLTINFELGLAFYYARDYDKAIQQFQKTLELDANFPLVHAHLPAAYEQKGMYDEAIAGFQKGITLRGGTEWSFSMSGLGHVYGLSGKKAEARAVLDELQRTLRQQYVPADSIALVYAGLGEKDQAFTWLEKAYQEHAFKMAWLKVDPQWDSLRSDPRFADLLRRVGLSQ
jgi:eukaryotic-like serine/threonine-protein kinase